jgi:hypothetical protein
MLAVSSLAFAMLVITVLPSAAGLIIGTVVVEGVVTGPGDVPIEGVTLEVVGMEEFNSTTDDAGCYTLVVPLIEVGHTLRLSHPDHARKDVATGPLEEGVRAYVNATMSLRAPQATLQIRILPWDIPGSNYGLRQDVMTVVNATGTPFFEWQEKSAEENAIVPAPGSYMVTASRPGYYPLTVLVTVERGDRLMVDLDLTDRKKPTYGTVNGTVEHEGFPLPEVTVMAEPEDGSRTYEAVTNGTGDFSMQLPNGTYKLSVVAKGYAKLSEGVEVELGETEEVYFPMTEAQRTGDDESPLMAWLAMTTAIMVLASVVAYAVVVRRKASEMEASLSAKAEHLECPSCGASAGPDDDRCAECGSTFPWKSFRCPDCGAVMELDAQRCPECGNQTFDLHRG